MLKLFVGSPQALAITSQCCTNAANSRDQTPTIPLYAGNGTGTALLASAVNSLHRMGFKQLLTTFMLGNTSSMLWHWRNGFRLLPYPASRRLTKQRQQQQ